MDVGANVSNLRSAHLQERPAATLPALWRVDVPGGGPGIEQTRNALRISRGPTPAGSTPFVVHRTANDERAVRYDLSTPHAPVQRGCITQWKEKLGMSTLTIILIVLLVLVLLGFFGGRGTYGTHPYYGGGFGLVGAILLILLVLALLGVIRI